MNAPSEGRARKIAVIGASGTVGKPAVARLAAAGYTLRALSSKETSATVLRQLGAADVVIGDFRKDGDIDRVVAGADAVLYIPPAMTEDEAEIGARVVASAQRHATPHLVYVSCFHSQISRMAHHRAKFLVEELVVESGLEYSILQPSMFMQNLLFNWADISAHDALRMTWHPDRRYNMVDVCDLADVIVAVMGDPGLRGGCYEVCGPQVLCPADMAAIVGKVLGRNITAEYRDPAEWEDRMRVAGISNWGLGNLAAMSRYYDSHEFSGGNPRVLEMLIGRKAATYEEFVRSFVASLPAEPARAG